MIGDRQIEPRGSKDHKYIACLPSQPGENCGSPGWPNKFNVGQPPAVGPICMNGLNVGPTIITMAYDELSSCMKM